MNLELIFYVFVVMQVADAITTFMVLEKGGRELNPAMRYVMERIGVVPALLITKGVIIALVWTYARGVFEVMAILTLIYVIVVANNLLQLRKG